MESNMKSKYEADNYNFLITDHQLLGFLYF